MKEYLAAQFQNLYIQFIKILILMQKMGRKEQKKLKILPYQNCL